MMRGGGVGGGARRPRRRTAPFPLERALVLAFVACVVGGYVFLYINIQRAMNQEARHKAEVGRMASSNAPEGAGAGGEGELGWEAEGSCSAVVFFHIPKTGGTTLNGVFTSTPGWSFYRAKDRRTWNMLVGALSEGGTAPPLAPGGVRPRRVVVELHTLGSPTFMQALPGLERLRKEYVEGHGCRLTTFTMLREPVTAAVSSYQYACKPLYLHDHRSCPGMLPGLSKWSFFKGLRHDLQASFLLGGWGGEWNAAPPPPAGEVAALREAMRRHLDVVGLMEDFDTSLARLRQAAGMARVPYRARNVGGNKKKQERGGWRAWLYSGAFEAEDLSEGERSEVLRSQSQDDAIYQDYVATLGGRGEEG